MRILDINVTGKLHLNLQFKNINVLLGENNTGKSTFVKLILYALGVEINDFIDEIAKEEMCNSVSISILTKSGNYYLITRKLPYADIVNVFPVDKSGTVMTEEVLVYNLEEYSDFLLDEELYPKETISYGKGKTASLRYYFLLRSAVVDQTTPHARILSNLSGEKNDYISNQPLINTAIIEEVLNRNTSEIQKLRLMIKDKEKERNSINSRISFLNEIISKKLEENPDFPNKTSKINVAIETLEIENNKLTSEQYSVLTELEQTADKEIEKRIILLKKELNKEKQKRTEVLLNISDTRETIDKLENELSTIKKRLVSRQIIQNIPVTICPICFSKFDGEYLCEHCKDVDASKSIENLSGYKKMIDDSLKEANVLLKQYNNNLKEDDKKINDLNSELNRLKEEYLQRLNNLRTPLQEIIEELKCKIQHISNKQIALNDLLSYIVDCEKSKNIRKMINEQLTDLKDDYENASKKSLSDITIINTWLKYYLEIYNTIFDSKDNQISFDDCYMPSINDTAVHKISSESVKLVAQLSYIYSLATLNELFDTQLINHIGFIIFDSPKDKDLDIDKYKRFLTCLNETKNVQIFLTGSIKDADSYKGALSNANFLPTLSEENRLLKNSE